MKTVSRRKVSRPDGSVSYYMAGKAWGIIHFSKQEAAQGRDYMAGRLRRFRRHLSTTNGKDNS